MQILLIPANPIIIIMSRLQSIEQALVAINETVFQELCDSFLVLRNPNYTAFSRSGSQSAKQKTIKGSPDSFFLMHDGKYLMIEYSTNITRGVAKLEEDVIKCLDEQITKIPVSAISEIILCLNFNIKNADIDRLNTLLSNYNIRLTIYTLDALSIELHINHRNLAHQYLGLPLDTEQVVSIGHFVEEYNNAYNGIATPLDNPFLHRTDENKRFTSLLDNHDFIVLCGSAGVGKTKLALQGIESYINDNQSFNAYCISYKNHTLFDDLQQHISKDGNYILFVDDANRIDAFSQILGFKRELRTGKLKIVLTVRDYAYLDLKKMCGGIPLVDLYLEKLSDDHLKDIISGEPWNIRNGVYQDRIIAIAEGNPRLAIMAAQLALAKQSVDTLYDVTDLFDNYFNTFIKDKDEINDELTIKVLGLIAFFHTVPFKERQVTEAILETFGISYTAFIDRIDRLDRFELVDVQFKHVKISEQNLAIFFFYRAFIELELLSFQQLLEGYADSNAPRLRECIVASNNTFGPDKVMQKVKPFLQRYVRNLRHHKLPIDGVLASFWFYLKDEILEHMLGQFSELENIEPEGYKLNYETNEFAYDKNPIISVIGNFFHHPDDYFKDAIELIFLFVRKKPVHLSEVIHKIRETLVFDYEDLHNGLLRQNALFDFLINGLEKKDKLLSLAFFELAKTFMQFSFEQFKGARGNTMQFYTVVLEDTINIREFRERIWKELDRYFDEYPVEAFDVLQSYGERPFNMDEAVMQFDAVYIIDLIKKHLSIQSFEHCKYVQNQLQSLRKKNAEHPESVELRAAFSNNTYKLYLKLDWDRLRGKEDDGIIDYKDYEKLKEEEIRSSFIFSNDADIKEFYDSYTELFPDKYHRHNLERSLDIIIDENLRINFDNGCGLLRYILKRNNEMGYNPWLVFKNHLNEAVKAEKLWDVIHEYSFKERDKWKLSFYQHLVVNPFGPRLLDFIIETVLNTDMPLHIHLEHLSRFADTTDNFTQRLLRIIVSRNKLENTKLILWNNSFEDCFNLLGDDLVLIEESYLQQDKLQGHFDYKYGGLKNILKKDPLFLLIYVKSLYNEDRYRFNSDGEDLSFVWDFDNIESTLDQVFGAIVDGEINLGIGEHFCNCFFKRYENDWQQTRAATFILGYALKYNKDIKRMNIVVNIVRYSMKTLYKSVLAQHVTLNQDLELFERIWWRGNGGDVMWGEVIFGDIEAAEWRNVQSIIADLSLGLTMVPIKRYVSGKIEDALARADWERERRFRERV